MHNSTIKKPVALQVQPENIPPQMTSERRWVNWRYAPTKNGKWTKQPIQPSGTLAKSNDPQTWSAFDVCLAAYQSDGNFDGVGFMLGDGFAGLDLDDNVNDEGRYTWGADHIEAVATYGEISPGGAGVKMFTLGTKPKWLAESISTGHGPDGVGRFELYDGGRFFCVTGHILPGKTSEIRNCQPAVDAICELLWKRPAAHGSNGRAPPPPHDEQSKPYTTADLAVAIEAVKHLADVRADIYADWISVGQALHHVGRAGAEAFAAWEKFSKRSSKFEVGICKEKWDGFSSEDTKHRVGLKRLLDMALADCGWKPPPKSDVWPDPKPLPIGLPPVMPFDFNLLPESFHAWIQDIADRMQCPPDYLAVTAMVAAATLIGRKVGICPKRFDDWLIVPNLWAMPIGRPGLLKSPAMNEVLTPLRRLEAEADAEYADAVQESETAKLVNDVRRKAKMDDLRKAAKSGGDVEGIAAEMNEAESSSPVWKRFITSNTTVEKLGEILRDNPDGVMIHSDEAIGWLRSMEREGHESDRAFYLTAWAGDSRFIYDRIGRGTIIIPAACVSFVGSIQPGILRDYLRAAVAGGTGDDGFIQRVQLAVWPDAPTTWENVDRYPNVAAKTQAWETFQRLASLTGGSVSAMPGDRSDSPPFLRFDREAQHRFDAWRETLERRLRTGELHPAIESHLAKYRSLIPSLALLIHLIDGGAGEVADRSLERAITWGVYLESHAGRIYSSVVDAAAVAARELGRRLIDGDLPNPFTARDVYRKGWSGLDKESTVAAIDVLIGLDWLAERVGESAGRPKVLYAVNPQIGFTYRDVPPKPPKAPFGSNGSDHPKDNPVCKPPVNPKRSRPDRRRDPEDIF